MKILYLLIVYKNPARVKRIIEKLHTKDSLFLVHIDANSPYDFSAIKGIPNVHLATHRFKTPWGGPELAFAVLEALKESLQWEWDYVCLISESDYPIKSTDEIISFLKNDNKDHILISPLPCDNPLNIPGCKWLEGGRRRAECYALRLAPRKIATIEPRKFNYGNIRQLIKVLHSAPCKIIQALKILLYYPIRTTDVPQAGGHQWFVLKRKTTDVIIEFANSRPEFLEYCKDTQCLDEIFFPTIVNAVVDPNEISSNILRYISWDPAGGSSSPISLTINDKDIIDNCKSQDDIFFVRKVEDKKLCDYIDSI